jgi:hypothetical protein
MSSFNRIAIVRRMDIANGGLWTMQLCIEGYN